ncbi:MAG: hypothetical protein ACR2JB_06530 [Bryobacteraceae bacterium]
MKITRRGSQPSRQGPAENFTGSVRIDSSFQASSPARIYGARLAFEPGARTAWHTHPLGKVLIVTAGTGRVQRWGDPIDEIRRKPEPLMIQEQGSFAVGGSVTATGSPLRRHRAAGWAGARPSRTGMFAPSSPSSRASTFLSPRQRCRR